MDAIALLKDDHRTVKDLFRQFERTGPRGAKTKRRLVDTMIEELSVHAYIEEEIFYPQARTAVEKAEDDVLEAYEEHHIVEWTLSELQDMEPSDERFDAKVTVLHQGAVIAEGPPSDVRANAEVQRVYLGDQDVKGPAWRS